MAIRRIGINQPFVQPKAQSPYMTQTDAEGWTGGMDSDLVGSGPQAAIIPRTGMMANVLESKVVGREKERTRRMQEAKKDQEQQALLNLVGSVAQVGGFMLGGSGLASGIGLARTAYNLITQLNKDTDKPIEQGSEAEALSKVHDRSQAGKILTTETKKRLGEEKKSQALATQPSSETEWMGAASSILGATMSSGIGNLIGQQVGLNLPPGAIQSAQVPSIGAPGPDSTPLEHKQMEAARLQQARGEPVSSSFATTPMQQLRDFIGGGTRDDGSQGAGIPLLRHAARAMPESWTGLGPPVTGDAGAQSIIDEYSSATPGGAWNPQNPNSFLYAGNELTPRLPAGEVAAGPRAEFAGLTLPGEPVEPRTRIPPSEFIQGEGFGIDARGMGAEEIMDLFRQRPTPPMNFQSNPWDILGQQYGYDPFRTPMRRPY